MTKRLSHCHPPPPPQHPSESKIQRWKGFINKSFPSGRWELNDCSNVPNLWQICWQTGHLDWAGPAGNSCIWKLFGWQKLRHAPRTDIPPALTNFERKWVCVCVRNTCFDLLWFFFFFCFLFSAIFGVCLHCSFKKRKPVWGWFYCTSNMTIVWSSVMWQKFFLVSRYSIALLLQLV